jgi:hypothetical protein
MYSHTHILNKKYSFKAHIGSSECIWLEKGQSGDVAYSVDISASECLS